MTSLSELPGAAKLPGLSFLEDLESLSDADPRDLGSSQLSILRRLFETPDEGIGLFLFARTIFGYRDLTLNVHLPICRLLSRWGESEFEDGFVSASPVNQALVDSHGEVTQSYRRLMVTIPREHFKCLNSSVLVKTPGGSKPAGNLTVGDLVDSPDGLVRVLGNRISLTRGLRFKFATGRTVEVTENHPFLTTDGWKEAGRLSSKYAVATARSFTHPGGIFNLPYTAGVLTGDGCCGNRSLTCFDEEIIYGLRDEGVEVRPRSVAGTYGIPSTVWEDTQVFGGAWDKSIPSIYEGSGEFLSGLYDTDGCIPKGRGALKRINLITVSKQLAADVVRNLLYFGIYSRVRRHRTSGPSNYKGSAWHVNITGSENARRFQKHIGFKVRRKALRLQALIDSDHQRTSGRDYAIPPSWKNHLNHVPRGETKVRGDVRILKDSGLRIDNRYWTSIDKFQMALEILGREDLAWMTNFRWDKIVSVEPVEKMEIAELTVEGEHYYGADGILHHNTSLCTRANPIWHLARDPLHNYTFGIFNEKAENVQAWIFSITQTLERSRLFQLLWAEMLPRGVSLADQERGITRKRDIKWGAGGVLFERESNVPELSIEGHGIGGAVTGKHYTHKILDDIIGKEAAYSPAVMKSAIDWVDNSRPLERPAEDGCELVANTPWAFADVYSHMLTKWPGEYRVYRRHILENDEGEFDIQEGRPIMPEKFTLKKARSLFNKEHYFVNMAQYACLPLPSKDLAFNTQWLRYGSVLARAGAPAFRLKPEFYDPACFDQDCGEESAPQVVPLSWLTKAILLDPAPSKPAEIRQNPTAGNGIAVVGKDPWGRRYLLECRSERETPNRILEILHELSMKWETDLIGIEEVNFSAVYAPLYEEIARFRWPDWRPQLFPLKPKGREKYSRIRAAWIGPLESGFWIFNTHGTAKAIREMIEFGVAGSTVDILDSAAYTDEVLQRPETPTETAMNFQRQVTESYDRGLTGYGRFFQEESPR